MIVNEFNNLFIHFIDYEMVENLEGTQIFGSPLVTIYRNASTTLYLAILDNNNIGHCGGMTDNSCQCFLHTFRFLTWYVCEVEQSMELSGALIRELRSMTCWHQYLANMKSDNRWWMTIDCCMMDQLWNMMKSWCLTIKPVKYDS